MSALARRAERRARGGAMVDLNLVSLIDVFTILIFFLLAHALEPQTLSLPGGVVLPEAASELSPRDGLELAVDGQDLLLQGQRVAALTEPGMAELRLALQARVGNAAPPLVLVADRELPYQSLRAVMAAAAGAGLTEISFAVRRPEAP